MAGRIAGITIEIGGDTTNLQKSLKGVDSQLKTTQSNLKDINKLLKFDPGNTELLRQKQQELERAISTTKDRLAQLKDAQSKVSQGSAEWDRLQREIIETENNLKTLEGEYRNFGSVAKQQLQAVGDKVKEAGGKIEEAGHKIQGISAAAAAVGGALIKLGLDAATSADDLNTLAKQTGVSTAELQKMQYAADLVDVSVSDITGAMRKLKTKIDPSNEALANLGVSATNADGSLRSTTDVFFDVIQALSQVENETERDQLAMELFGKSADSLAGIIDDGGAALRQYGQEAEDLGLILDQDTLDALNGVNDTIDKTKAQIKGTMAVIGAEVLPVLQPLLEKGAELVGKIAEKLGSLNEEQTETILKVIGIVAAAAPALIMIGKLVTGVGSLISGIGSVVGFLGGPLTIAIAAAVAAGILIYKNWDKIKAAAINLKNGAVAAWNELKANVSSVVDSVKAKIDTFKAKFDELKDKVTEVWNTIKGILQGKITLPHIPLPHFKIMPPGWKIGDLLEGTIPSLGIAWYKKAYDNPVMFTSPTVMATPNGYKGFGDGHGAEIVMGLDKLRELVAGQNTTVQVVLEGDARGLFRVVQKTNATRTRATNYNAMVGV